MNSQISSHTQAVQKFESWAKLVGSAVDAAILRSTHGGAAQPSTLPKRYRGRGQPVRRVQRRSAQYGMPFCQWTLSWPFVQFYPLDFPALPWLEEICQLLDGVRLSGYGQPRMCFKEKGLPVFHYAR